MINGRIRAAALLVVLLATVVVGIAVAHPEGERRSLDDSAALTANAKIALAQAISTAEQQVGGKAVSASIEVHREKAVYVVDVVKDGQIRTALVDTQTGALVDTFVADGADGDDGDEDDCRPSPERARAPVREPILIGLNVAK